MKKNENLKQKFNSLSRVHQSKIIGGTTTTNDSDVDVNAQNEELAKKKDEIKPPNH